MSKRHKGQNKARRKIGKLPSRPTKGQAPITKSPDPTLAKLTEYASPALDAKAKPGEDRKMSLEAKNESLLNFIYAVLSTVLPLGWSESIFAHPVPIFVHAVVAAICWAIPCGIISLILWRWANSGKAKVATRCATGVLWIVYSVVAGMFISAAKNPTFIVLVPSADLFDAERRAFVMQCKGSGTLENVEVDFWDNDAKKGQTERVDCISGATPDPKFPKYFWWAPSKPWAENYTITFNSKNLKETQHLSIRDVDKRIQLATVASLGGKRLYQCRDHSIPIEDKTALGSSDSCAESMKLSDGFDDSITPQPFNIQRPDLSVTVRRLRTIEPMKDIESSAEYRRLDDYQRAQLHLALEGFPRTKLLIFYSKGKETKSYAEDFADVFRGAAWTVARPKQSPKEDNFYIDTALSTDSSISTKPAVESILEGFTKAGIKHATLHPQDDNVPTGVIVLWIGYKSPPGTEPDECSSPVLVPSPTQHQPCEMVNQVPNGAPYPPGTAPNGVERYQVYVSKANGTESKK